MMPGLIQRLFRTFRASGAANGAEPLTSPSTVLPSSAGVAESRTILGEDDRESARELFNTGRDVAQASGDPTFRENAVAPLEALGRARARINGSNPYAPGAPDDGRIERRDVYEWNRLEWLTKNLMTRVAAQYQAEREAACLGAHAAMPTTPILAGLLLAGAQCVPLSISWHDLVFSTVFAAPQAAYGASIIAGLCISALLAWVILGRDEAPPDPWYVAAAWWLVAAVFSYGFFKMRESITHGSEPKTALAVGLAAVEFSILGFGKLYSDARRRWTQAVLQENRDIDEKQRLAAVERELVEHTRADIEATNLRLATLHGLIVDKQERARRAGHVGEVNAAAARAGALAGAHTTEGFLFGAATKAPNRRDLLSHGASTRNGHHRDSHALFSASDEPDLG